jgi:hypothetical protein
MIDFLYCLDYDDHRLDAGFQFEGGAESMPAVNETATEEQTGLNASSLLVNAKTYIMAEKYNIESK